MSAWLLSIAYVLGGMYVITGLMVGLLPVVALSEGKHPRWVWALAVFWPASSVLFVLACLTVSVHSCIEPKQHDINVIPPFGVRLPGCMRASPRPIMRVACRLRDAEFVRAYTAAPLSTCSA